MLTHKNVIAAVSATKMQITLDVGPRKDDCMISFLPLSHMLVSEDQCNFFIASIIQTGTFSFQERCCEVRA